MEELKRAELLRDFLNSKKVHGGELTTDDMFHGLLFKKVRYGSRYNPSGLQDREGIGSVRYLYFVPEDGASVVQMLFLKRSGLTSHASCGHNWDFVDAIVHPLDEEKIPYIDEDILESIFKDSSPRTFRAYRKREEVQSEEARVLHHEQYSVSACGNYIVCRSSYEYFGPEDPDNNWQPIYQSGWSEPSVYRYNAYETTERFGHYVSNRQYYRGGDDFKVGKASNC